LPPPLRPSALISWPVEPGALWLAGRRRYHYAGAVVEDGLARINDELI